MPKIVFRAFWFVQLISMHANGQNARTTPIPGRLNVLIGVSAYAVALGCLVGAARSTSFWATAGFIVGFALVNNTIFSLLHESVHRLFHKTRWINDAFGQMSAAFFPTGFLFQRAFHLGHHRRNRSDVEMFDMYYPEDSRLLKFVQLYTILLGFYWTAAPVGGIVYLISPKFVNNALFRSQHKYLKPMSMDAMISGLEDIDETRTRWELLFTLVFQLFIIFGLGVGWKVWLAGYWSFAMLWGSVQYADHAWSVRDIRHGAWNLKVNRLVQTIFLNYHLHLAHHQNPHIPWIHLPRFVDGKTPQPRHLKIWLKMWKGPTLTTERKLAPLSPEFERGLYQSPMN